MQSTPEPWLVFSDDWGRHPSSCQHLIRQALAHREVHWVNTIGTRSPRFDLATVKRVAGKVRQWVRPNAATGKSCELPANLTVHNPKMWPWFKNDFDRWMNRRLLTRHLKPIAESLSSPPVIVTTLPIVADLVGRLPASRWVYYCVDDFSQWPGLDQKAMDRMERLLVTKVDRIIAVSETLQDRLRSLGRDDAELLTHGVDLECWRTTDISQKSEPKIVFWGVLDRRMDVDFVRQLSQDLTAGTILLVGPENDPDAALWHLPRVKKIAPLSFEELPALAAEANVLVMPYGDLPVTRAMQPLKLKEYLATGKPVVVRDLPANRDWADALDIASTPEEFSRMVRERIQTGIPESQRFARLRLSEESWAEKARQFEEWVGNPMIMA